MNGNGVKAKDLEVRLQAVSKTERQERLIVGFVALVTSADPHIVPFVPGDSVFGVMEVPDALEIGSVQTIQSDAVANKPQGMPDDLAADLAEEAVAAWITLFDQMRLPRDEPQASILLGLGDVRRLGLLVQLIQRLTALSIVIVGEPSAEIAALLRDQRDTVHTFDNFCRKTMSGAIRLPAYAIFHGPADNNIWGAADIVTCYDRAEGSLARAVTIAWADNIPPGILGGSMSDIGDILREITSLIEANNLTWPV